MNILITGTNSGFGRLTAETLARKGHLVFATMRGVDGKNAAAAAELRALAERDGLKLRVVELDVGSQASVDAAVKRILEQDGHIDAAVNNAGLSGMGFTETFTAEQVQALFDVNVVGVQRVNRAVLPSMRARGAGLLVHISSSIGRWLVPCMGVYCATKFALDALAESYRYELALTGVDSVLVEPGAYPTEFSGKGLYGQDQDRVPGYGEAAQIPQQLGAAMQHMFAGGGPNPQLVADAVAKLVDTPAGQRPLRTVVDPLTGAMTEAINRASGEVQGQVMNSMGLGALLQLKTKTPAA